MFKQRKYDDMYLRAGVINDEDPMGWMELDYDERTLKDITKNSSPIVFLENLLDILKVDSPNINFLSNSLGEFIKKDRVLYSNSVYNKAVKSIELFSVEKSKFDTETSKIVMQFEESLIIKNIVEDLLELNSIDELRKNKNISKVENPLVSFSADLICEISLDEDYIDKITFEYVRK